MAYCNILNYVAMSVLIYTIFKKFHNVLEAVSTC